MYSGNESPSFSSWAEMDRAGYFQEQVQTGTTVDAQPYGGSVNNPMAAQHADIHGQPLSFGDWEYRYDQQTSLNQWQTGFSPISGSYERYTYERPPSIEDVRPSFVSQTPDSDQRYSYGEPPSVGAVRQVFVSQPSGGDQIYSDGQPPTLNDFHRRAKNKLKKVRQFFLKNAMSLNVLKKFM
ncbi:hypothetical protein L1887_23653 [Cichorium endivia]|nr:hypothetical protein L1887_23653 [Cichorium endivia]